MLSKSPSQKKDLLQRLLLGRYEILFVVFTSLEMLAGSRLAKEGV